MEMDAPRSEVRVAQELSARLEAPKRSACQLVLRGGPQTVAGAHNVGRPLRGLQAGG